MTMLIKMRNKYEDQAGDAGTGAGGGTSASADATNAGQAGASQADGAGAQSGASGQAASVLGGTPQGAQQAQDGGFNWIPEKHRVANADGSIDMEASFRKNAEAYAHLEQRLGSGDVPPKTAEEYAPTVEAAEGFDMQAFMADEGTKGFLKGAHAKGMTNEQVSYVLSQYTKVAPDLVQGGKTMGVENVQSQLKEVWKDQAEYDRNIDAYYKTAKQLADRAGVEYNEAEMGAPPVWFVRMMAAIAPEFAEDTSPNTGASVTGSDDIQKIMASEAYTNTAHPDHAAVSKQVKQYFERKYGTQPVF